MRLLRLHLEAAWLPMATPRGAEQVRVAEARETLGPILRCWPGEIVFGHYGAVRGLNTMADVDALITLGDPWPHLGDARNDAAFLGLAQAWQQRLEAMCRAELEQAHGRIRPVHRARPGRALHVGTMLPSGYGWTSGSVEMRSMPRGPRPASRTCRATSSERSSTAPVAREPRPVGSGAAMPPCCGTARDSATCRRACSRGCRWSRFPLSRGWSRFCDRESVNHTTGTGGARPLVDSVRATSAGGAPGSIFSELRLRAWPYRK